MDARRGAFFLFLSALSLCVCASARPGSPRPDTRAHDGLSLTSLAHRYPVIHLPANAPPELAAAAGDLQRILTLRTDRQWRIKESSGRLHKAGVFLGELPEIWLGKQRPEFAWRDEFAIEARPNQLLLYGGNPLASAFAVWHFIEHRLGVSWLMPGEMGEVIAENWSTRIPYGSIHHSPSYISRALWIRPATKSANQWMLRNRQTNHFSVNHNLHRVFSPSFLQENPHYLPEIRGTAVPPDQMHGQGPQPNIAVAGAVEHATEAARQFFENNPNQPAFSLAPADSADWSQDPLTRSLIQPKGYFRRQPDYSPLLFTFVNRVAARVAREYPHKYLSVLAYWTTQQVPPVRVQKQVLPVLASDKYQYYDPAFEAEDQAWTRAWGESGAAMLALWDYPYGGQYLVPRLMPWEHAQSLVFAHRNKTRVYFGPTSAYWGFDGPKLWMTARILWDIDENPGQLFDHYLELAYGPAAPFMKEFYEDAAAIWAAQPPPAIWLKCTLDISQGSIFSPDEAQALAGVLQLAHAKAETEAQRARIELTIRTFETTRLLSRYYRNWHALSANALDNQEQIEAFHNGLHEWEDKRAELLNNLREREDMAPSHHQYYTGDFLIDDPTDRLAYQAHLQENDRPNRLRDPGFQQTPWARYPSMHAAALNQLPHEGTWSWNVSDAQEGRFTLREVPTEYGKQASVLKQTGIINASVFQWLPATSGTEYAFGVRVRGNITHGNTARLLIMFTDAEGRRLTHGVGADRLPQGTYEDWRTLAVVMRAPPGAQKVYFGLKNRGQSPSAHLEWAFPAMHELDHFGQVKMGMDKPNTVPHLPDAPIEASPEEP